MEHEITTALMNEIALLKAQLAKTQRLVDILTENTHALLDPRDATEEKTAELRGDRTILNFVGLVEPACTAETYYLRVEDTDKYVPIAEGLGGSRPLIGELLKAPVPTQWATHFTDGRIPFLPVCPCCSNPTQMIAAVTVHETSIPNTRMTVRERYIRSVECNDYNVSLQVPPTPLTGASVTRFHYKWDASSGKHYKNGMEWDPVRQ